MSRMKPVVDFLLLAAILIGLFYSSSQPYEKQDMRGALNQYLNTDKLESQFGGISFSYGGMEISIEEAGVAGFVEFFIRKGTHFLTFAALTLMFFRVLRYFASAAVSLPWSGFLTALVAMLDEWHQVYTPNRTGLLTDVLLDTAGASAMLLAISLWLVYFRKRPRVRRSDKNGFGHSSYRK